MFFKKLKKFLFLRIKIQLVKEPKNSIVVKMLEIQNKNNF